MTSRIDDGPHPVSATCLVCLEQDRIALCDIDREALDFNWVNKRAVSFDDCRSIVIDAESN